MRLSLLLLLCSCALPAQDASKPRFGTKLEAFSARTGQLLIHDSFLLQTPKPTKGFLTIHAVVISNAATREKEKGFSIYTSGPDVSDVFGSTFLDLDEARDVIKAIAEMDSISQKPIAEQSREVIFHSRGNFTVGFEMGNPNRFYCIAGSSASSMARFEKSGDMLAVLTSLMQTFDDGLKLLQSK